MAIELATAYISVLPSTSKLAPEIGKELGKIPADKSGGQIGDGLLAGIGKTLKVGAIAVGATAVAGIGVALTKGFSRLDSLDQATAKLTGLGHSAETVQSIMANALASVKGTAFGMDEAASTAAGAVAAGIKPGEDLERTLKLVADAATIAGTDMGSMGSIFNKVAASGKLQGDVIAQLQDAGVPILQMVASQIGATAAETAELASKGEISFDTFRRAMEAGLGGAALESGSTFSGAMDNAMAALGRVGANLLTGIFPQLKDGLSGLTEFLAPIEEKAKEIGAGFGEMLTQLVSGLTMSSGTRDEFAGQMEGLVLVGANVRAAFEGIGTVLGVTFGWVGENLELIKNLAIAFGLAGAAILVYRGVVAAIALPTKIATAAQLAWNAVLALNPMGLIITAIVALVAAIIWVATQTTFFQEAWANVSAFFIDLWTNVSAFFIGVWTNISSFFTTVWEAISGAITDAYTGVIKPIIDAIGAVFTWLYQNIIFPIIIGIMLYIGLWAALFQWLWNTVLSPILTALGALFTWVYETIIKPIFDGIGVAINFVAAVISTALGIISGVWQTVWGAISSFFGMIWGVIVSAVTTYINLVMTVIRTVVGVISGIWNTVWSAISSFFIGIWNKIVGAVQTVGSVFQNAFSGIAGFVKSAFESVLGAIKNPINAIIGLVNRAIDGLNSLSVTIPDWVPLVGGQTWGLSLPKIPKLADGAIINSSRGGSLVNVGEGRYDEAVVPLGGPQFDRLASSLADRSGGARVQVDQHFAEQDPVLAQRAAGRELARVFAAE